MDDVKQPKLFFLLCLTGLWLIIGGCASVDTVRFTSQTFPPKNSIQEVDVLSRTPKRAHVRIAQLSVEDAALGYEKEQEAILKKAAKLGADAVVFPLDASVITNSETINSYWSRFCHQS